MGKITAIASYKPIGGNKSFCFVSWSSGVLELYDVPDFNSCYIFSKFTQMHSTVMDENPSETEIKEILQQLSAIKHPYVMEMAVSSIGAVSSSPYLIVLLSNGEIHYYRSFVYSGDKKKKAQSANKKRLQHLRFAKMEQIDLVHKQTDGNAHFNELFPNFDKEGNTIRMETELLDKDRTFSIFKHSPLLPQLVPFDNIGGERGVFVCGEVPLLVGNGAGQV